MVCTYCGVDRPLEDFYVSTRSKWCRPCFVAYQAAKRSGVSPPVRVHVRGCETCGVEMRGAHGAKRFCSVGCRVRVASVRSCACCGEVAVPRRKYCAPCGDLAVWVRSFNGRPGVDRLDARALRAMLDRQGWMCAACGDPLALEAPLRGRKHSMCIDHDHATGRVRGVVHHSCNAGLGMARDSDERLFAWQAYLARHSLDLRELCVAA